MGNCRGYNIINMAFTGQGEGRGIVEGVRLNEGIQLNSNLLYLENNQKAF